MRGEGALPVSTGEVGRVACGGVELVGDGDTGLGVHGVGGHVDVGVIRDVGRDQRGIAAGLGARSDAASGQNVVLGGVCVGACGDVVGARVKDVGLGTVGVIGLELLAVELDGEGLALAGLQELGLAKAHELDGGLLNAVGAVVVGVGTLGVELHDVLARTVAGVLDGHRGGALLAVP